MIIRIVKLSIETDKVEDFLVHFEQVKNDIRSFKGCSHLDLLGEISASGVLFTYSHWDSQEALEGYLGSTLFKSTWSKVKPLFKAKAEAWSLNMLQEVKLG